MDYVKHVYKTKENMEKSFMKKTWIFLLTCIMLTFIVGCTNQTATKKSDDQLQIMTTLFPQYDFAKQIAGDKAEVTLLLPTGVESHAYEPTPKDMISINNADLLIYTGKNMETWVPKLLTDLDRTKTTVLDLSKNLTLKETHQHAHETEEEHAKHAHDEHNHGTIDPHIWTNPVYAQTMVKDILQAMIKKDPKNKAYYTKNAQEYIKQLEKIDTELKEVVANGKRNKIIFAGHFALSYFAKQYGLEYVAAYPNTSSESEPSVKDIANIIETMKIEKIPVVYYEELIEPKIAKSIQEQTGAKMHLLHSLHNISKDEFDQGVSYVSIMKQNIENLKEGLN